MKHVKLYEFFKKTPKSIDVPHTRKETTPLQYKDKENIEMRPENINNILTHLHQTLNKIRYYDKIKLEEIANQLDDIQNNNSLFTNVDIPLWRKVMILFFDRKNEIES